MRFIQLLSKILLGSFLAAPLGAVAKHSHQEHVPKTKNQGPTHSGNDVPLKVVFVDNKVVAVNTTGATSAPIPANVDDIKSRAIASAKVSSKVLIIARDSASAYSGYSGLAGYGIPYQVLLVPSTGTTLPALNSSMTVGNFGAIVVLSEVSYDYGAAGFQSALTTAQWSTLYGYQVAFGVRMVRIDVFPSSDTGTTVLGGCCGTGVEQLLSISDRTSFPTAGLIVGAGISTVGVWHYPATISNATIATAFAEFAPTTGFSTTSTAGVINNISGRQQMVFFLGFATDWNQGSNFMQHAWIHWALRGIYTGYRRVNFNTQVDDMFLESDIYSPAGNTFRIRTGDLDAHKSWMPTLNAKLSTGSNYFIEIGHNGNGNIEAADDAGARCGIGPIEYADQIDTALEFQKPLGTGTNLWPSSPANYPYTTSCVNADSLKTWFATTSNRDSFAHISHTFTHESLNNATYYDADKEIAWNKAWLTQVGLSATGAKYSSQGIIPPAITGLHNGDALSAWSANGIKYVVGDNTRPVLLNTNNEHWPLITTVSANGFAGIQITPRWATNIYYNCDLPACTVAEWTATAAGSGDFNALLTLEKTTNTRHLLGLHHDPFMFHQANLRQTDVSNVVINGVSAQLSLLQAWVETVLQEMIRLTTWPIITLKHDDISVSFANRAARDACNPTLTYQVDATGKTINGVTVTTTGNTCTVPIPVTVPGTVTSTQGFTTEQIGSDPLTIWAIMNGSPITFTLTTPITL